MCISITNDWLLFDAQTSQVVIGKPAIESDIGSNGREQTIDIFVIAREHLLEHHDKMTSLCQEVDYGCLRRHGTSRLPESLSRIYSGMTLFLILSCWHFQKCLQFQPSWKQQQWLEEACRMADNNVIWKMKSSHAKFIWRMGALKRKDTWENESFKSIITWFQKAQASIFCLPACLPLVSLCFPPSKSHSLKTLVRTHAPCLCLIALGWHLLRITFALTAILSTSPGKEWKREREKGRKKRESVLTQSLYIIVRSCHCSAASWFLSRRKQRRINKSNQWKKNQQIETVLEKDWASMLTVVMQAKQSPLHPPACAGPVLWEVCVKSVAKNINHAVSHTKLQTTKRIHGWYRMMGGKREGVPISEETGWEGRTACPSCKCGPDHIISNHIN